MVLLWTSNGYMMYVFSWCPMFVECMMYVVSLVSDMDAYEYVILVVYHMYVHDVYGPLALPDFCCVVVLSYATDTI